MQPLLQILQSVAEGAGAPVHRAQHMAGIEVGILRSCQLPLQPRQTLCRLLYLPPARKERG